MYDMRRLHNIYYADIDSNLLINNPSDGRLAVNTFVYSGSYLYRRCSAYQVGPEGCMTCVSDPSCVWVRNKCYPSNHATKRYASNEIIFNMKSSYKCDDQRIYKMHGVESKCIGRKCVPLGRDLEIERYVKTNSGGAKQ